MSDSGCLVAACLTKHGKARLDHVLQIPYPNILFIFLYTSIGDARVLTMKLLRDILT